jgi:hypothetical protein
METRLRDAAPWRVPGGEGLTMKSGDRGPADGLAGKHIFAQEPFEDVTDGLHTF